MPSLIHFHERLRLNSLFKHIGTVITLLEYYLASKHSLSSVSLFLRLHGEG